MTVHSKVDSGKFYLYKGNGSTWGMFMRHIDGVTFFPDWERYGAVKPQLSDVDWIRETDWLQLMIDACRKRGLAVGTEVSHFPIPKSLIETRPDWQQRKIDGSSWSSSRCCPNSPEVREYVIALFGDLAANYDLDYIQTCQLTFASPISMRIRVTARYKLFVGDREVVSFKLDEDVDCWRWRRFNRIQVNQGNEIRLVAQSDQHWAGLN